MNKYFPVAALLGVFALSFALKISHPSNPHAEFDRITGRLMRGLSERSERGEEKKYDNPEMFFEYDRIRRIDPATGRVPENGLILAYQEILRQQQANNTRTNGTNQSVVWQERGPDNVGGRTRGFMFDPNDGTQKSAFAGGVGGGLWHNTDVTSGATVWSNVNPMFSNIAVTCIAYDPTNTQIMYFGTGEGWRNADAQQGAGVWKSTDGGTTWNVIPSTQISSFFHIQKIGVNSLGQVFVGTKGGLQKSIDQGLTFSKVLGTGTGQGLDWITDLEFSANGDLFVGIDGSGAYRSLASNGANQGEIGTWTRLTTNFSGGFARVELATAPSNSNYVYALTSVGNQSDKIYRSTDNGSSWAPTTAQPSGGNFASDQAWYDLCIEVSETDENTVYVGGIDIWKTNNSGSSWSRVTLAYGWGTEPYMHPDQHGIFFRPGSGSQIVFTNDGGIHYTSNGGPDVNTRNNGYNVTQFYAMATDEVVGSNVIIGGTQDNGTQKVNSPGIGSAVEINGADGGYCAISHINPNIMFATTQYKTVRRSTNGGNSFSSISNPNLTDSDVNFINVLAIDVNNHNMLFQASKALWRHNSATTGGGNNWAQATANLSASIISAIATSKSEQNLAYIGAGGVVYRAPDIHLRNQTYMPDRVNPSGTPSGNISCIAVDPQDANHIVITFTNYGLYSHVMETHDADQTINATWKNVNGNLPDLPVNWAVFEPNNANGILIGTDLGAFRCGDISVPENQIYWSPERTGMGYPRVNMLTVRSSDKTVHACTHGRGFFSTDSYNQVPIADFGLIDVPACGGEVRFVDSTQNAPSAWSWDFGDGNTSTVPSPLHTYLASGVYTVKLVVSNVNGTDSTEKNYNITVFPNIIADAGPDTVILCRGDSVQLSASGGATFQWSPTDGLSDPNIANPWVVINSTRVYSVTATDANGCSDDDQIMVLVKNGPNTWAGPDQSLTQIGDSVQLSGFGGVTFVWSPAYGLSCTNCQNPKASPDTTTVYTLTSYDTFGCHSSDKVTIFGPPVGIDAGLSSKFTSLGTVYPNPVNGIGTVSYSLSKPGMVQLSLIALDGRNVLEILSENKAAGSYTASFSTEKLASGIYFLRYKVGEDIAARKIVVK